MIFSSDFKILHLVSDEANWSISDDMRQMKWIAETLGYSTGNLSKDKSKQKAIFYGCQFAGLIKGKWKEGHRIAVSYFHGLPGTGHPEFDQCFEALEKNKEEIYRLHVSHQKMYDAVLKTGIDSRKVHRIPIGIDLKKFHFEDKELKQKIRKQLEIPSDAFVVGSFQKDGNGWMEGLEPKLIKGPDVFVEAMSSLIKKVPNLWVFLMGPSRGYVKRGLERAGVPFRHLYMEDYNEIPKMYQALDAYLVSSRQEGGPKAVLESMASGVSIVSTRVGQAAELIRHEVNGWLVEVEDANNMTDILEKIYKEPKRSQLQKAAYQTALKNTYESQLPLWNDFFKEFVKKRGKFGIWN